MQEHSGGPVPIYTLKDLAETLVPAALAITVTSVTTGPAAVRLDIITSSGTPASVARPRPGMLVIPPGPARLVIRAYPADGPTFAAGAEVELSLAVGHARQPGAVLVRLARTDVSGLPFRDLVILDPRGANTAISATLQRLDRALSPLATMARVAARAVLGTDSLAPGRSLKVLVEVDISASMNSVRPTDSVSAAIDLLTGLATVISPDSPVELAAVGVDRTDLPPESGSESGLDFYRRLRLLPTSTGLLAAAAADPPDAAGPVLTYLITDGLPADTPINGANRGPHLVVLLPVTAWRVASAGSAVPATLIEPPADGGDLMAALLASPATVGSIVSSLLDAVPAMVTS